MKDSIDNQISKREEDQDNDSALDLTEDIMEDRKVSSVTEEGSATTVVEWDM